MPAMPMNGSVVEPEGTVHLEEIYADIQVWGEEEGLTTREGVFQQAEGRAVSLSPESSDEKTQATTWAAMGSRWNVGGIGWRENPNGPRW